MRFRGAEGPQGTGKRISCFVLRRNRRDTILPETDHGVRSAAGTVPRATRGSDPGATLPERDAKGTAKKKKGNPQFNLREELFRMTRYGPTQIDGIDVMTAMTVVSEVGWDMSKWKTENHFVSWLKLSPDNKISGAKSLERSHAPNNRATTVLRMAVHYFTESDSYLGAQFRRFRTRWGLRWRTKAMAAKLARLVYRMLRYGMKYVNQGASSMTHNIANSRSFIFKRKAAQLGLEIIEVAAVA